MSIFVLHRASQTAVPVPKSNTYIPNVSDFLFCCNELFFSTFGPGSLQASFKHQQVHFPCRPLAPSSSPRGCGNAVPREKQVISVVFVNKKGNKGKHTYPQTTASSTPFGEVAAPWNGLMKRWTVYTLLKTQVFSGGTVWFMFRMCLNKLPQGYTLTGPFSPSVAENTRTINHSDCQRGSIFSLLSLSSIDARWFRIPW